MRGDGTLKYSKVFIVNPGTPEEATYSDLIKIRAKKHSNLGLYIVRGQKDENGNDASIINAAGEVITKEKYFTIAPNLRSKGGMRTIAVLDKNGKMNLIDETGQRIFNDWYDGIKFCQDMLVHLCVIEKDGCFGLANLKDGRILVRPRWLEVSQIFGTALFKVVDKKTSDYYRWGIMNREGVFVHVPMFTDRFLPYVDWDIFNKVTLEPTGDQNGMQKVKILDAYGTEIYNEDCIWCKRYRDAENDSTERAFLFAKKFSYYGDSLTKKIAIFNSRSDTPSFLTIVPRKNRI